MTSPSEILIEKELDYLNAVEHFFQRRAEARAISCKSFIVTVFGDVISMHGGEVWLGSLIESLSPLGFSERLIRTSVFRLVKEGWLEVLRQGRKSFYRFTPMANNQYKKAARRIYSVYHQADDGKWLIVLPVFVDEEKLPDLKRELSWMGFSPLVNGAYAHPSINKLSLNETIEEMNLQKSVVIFESEITDEASRDALRTLVSEKWSLNLLQSEYENFIALYQKFSTRAYTHLTDKQAFVLRLLLIHDYRRILLKDHELPNHLLPENWAGTRAMSLVKNLYSALLQPSTRYVLSNLENSQGFLSMPDNSVSQRFC